MKISDAFIKSEMLAEQFIDDVKSASRALKEGQASQCLALLNQLQKEMEQVLEQGSAYDIEHHMPSTIRH